MPLPSAPATKNDGDAITAALWNSNNSLWYTALANYVVFKDVASQIVTKSLTFTPDSGVGFTVSQGGATITAGGLTVTAGGITVAAGGVTATTGNVAITAGNLTFGAASAKIIPGATSLLIRDTADANTNVTVTDAGAMTVRAGLTVTAGGATITAGGLTVSADGASVTGNSTVTGTLTVTSTLTAAQVTLSGTTPKLLTGSTSLRVRDSGDANTIATMSMSTLSFTPTYGELTFASASNGAYLTAAAGYNVHLGQPLGATTDTSRFVCLAGVAGAPTGIPSPVTGGYVPIVMDSSNQRMYAYMGGAWVKVQFT